MDQRRRRSAVGIGALAVVGMGLSACSDSTGPPSDTGEGWISVSAGSSHACALNADGRAFCWGDNSQGQFGDASTLSSTTPVSAGGDRLFETLTAVGDHTCGVVRGGRLACWGRNNVGELGIGSPFPSPVPQEVRDGDYTQLHPGFYLSCGTDQSGNAECWGGSRWSGSLPLNTVDGCPGYYATPNWPCARAPRAFSSPVAFEALELGLFFGCGISTGGESLCWGMNDFGQLGFSALDSCESGGVTRPCARSPGVVNTTVGFESMAAGTIHTCALDDRGRAYCWGATALGFGELGIGDANGAADPVSVQTDVRFEAIYASKANQIRGHSCGISLDASAWCWGSNEEGALGAPSEDICVQGDTDTSCALTPIQVAGGLQFSSLALGGHFTCGLAAGDVYCWGDNELGQLGDGSNSIGRVPQLVQLPEAE